MHFRLERATGCRSPISRRRGAIASTISAIRGIDRSLSSALGRYVGRRHLGERDHLSANQKRWHAVYALTNWSAETFSPTKKKFGFLQEFDGIVVSGEEKAAKPDARLFHILLERYKIAASTALHIDDNADNIATAKQIGMHPIHFQNAPQLRQALQELKLL
ncbi:MAG: HAD-IA family hydrolase [bacterium]